MKKSTDQFINGLVIGFFAGGMVAVLLLLLSGI